MSQNEMEYITGTGVVFGYDGRIDISKSIESAKNDLYKNILEVTGKHVSTHTVLKNTNGNNDYRTVTAVDSGIVIHDRDIQYIPMDGYWLARIEKSKVVPQEVKWVEQNIVINNSYAPTHSSTIFGTPTTTTVTRHDRRQNVIGPSGRVVKTRQGRTTRTIETRAWNGSYGWRYTRER